MHAFSRFLSLSIYIKMASENSRRTDAQARGEKSVPLLLISRGSVCIVSIRDKAWLFGD